MMRTRTDLSDLPSFPVPGGAAAPGGVLPSSHHTAGPSSVHEKKGRRKRLPAALVILLSLLGAGCGDNDAIHASLLEAEDSETPEPMPFDHTWWSCPLHVDEGWIVADTDVTLYVPEQTGDTFDVYIRYEDGSLVLAGTTIPADTWGRADGTWIAGRSQLLINVTFAGHSFQYDADVSTSRYSLEGWFSLDVDYELFVHCSKQI